jgi:hypothetical protein
VISGYVIHGDSDDSHDPVEAESAVSDGLDCQAAVAYYEAVFATHQAYGDTQEQRKLQVEYWEDVIVPAGNQMEDACTQ